jgi:hypothetical protein
MRGSGGNKNENPLEKAALWDAVAPYFSPYTP